MSTELILFVGAENVVDFTVTDPLASGGPVDTAEVMVETITNRVGATVAGFPLAGIEAAGLADGVYRVIIPDTAALRDGQRYYLNGYVEALGASGASLTLPFKLPCVARLAGAQTD